MAVNQDRINVFLHYRYFPEPRVELPLSLKSWFNGDLPGSDFTNASKTDLVKMGSKALKNSFKQGIENDHNKFHIVPLSGGLDSRTVLANLLEHVEPSKIIAVTFGLPGSPDYEGAQSIAKRAGVYWEGIDLSPWNWKWDTDMLIDTAKRSERPTWLFDSAVNHAIQLKYGKDIVYWSGFMGDSLGCIEPISNKVKTWDEAIAAFIRKSCFYNLKITSKSFIPDEYLPPQPFTASTKLDYYSQLNHCIKQQCLTKHIYSPLGYDIRYPFLCPGWVSFILSIPAPLGLRQDLYRKILKYSWPDLFNWWNSPYRDRFRVISLLHGGGRSFIRRHIKKTFPNSILLLGPEKKRKYIDWNYALLYQDDFKSTVYSNLQDLKTRKIIDWLDIDKLLTLHQKGNKSDLTFELMTLAALEIHLKANTIN